MLTRSSVIVPLCLLSIPFLLVAKKKPAEYPLQIQIVNAHWEHRNGAVHGWGRGNVKDGSSIHGFDYDYVANVELRRTVGNAYYMGKWKKEPVKLELLIGEIGAPDTLHTYEVKVNLRDEIYLPGVGDLNVAKPDSSTN